MIGEGFGGGEKLYWGAEGWHLLSYARHDGVLAPSYEGIRDGESDEDVAMTASWPRKLLNDR